MLPTDQPDPARWYHWALLALVILMTAAFFALMLIDLLFPELPHAVAIGEWR